MADKTLSLRIVTPNGIKLETETDMVILRCLTGEMGVLPGHTPYSAVLDYGILRFKNGETDRFIAVYGGLADIGGNGVTVITNDAEWPEDINLARAKASRDLAEERLRERTDDLELKYDQLLLRRALVQIEVGATAGNERDE